MDSYAQEIQRIADEEGIVLTIRFGDWDADTQALQVDELIADPPDMVVLVPESFEEDANLFAKLNRAGIPVIVGNMKPQPQDFRHIVAWTGPDDWLQSRALARHFAELCNFRGGYALVCHVPGTSTYLARAWGVITELTEIAPEMHLLEMVSTGFDPEETRRVVQDWLRRFGDDLVGIVSADDYLAQMGINQALAHVGREEVVRVANGSTTVGLDMIRSGSLHAVTFQSATADGGLAIRAAVDWFNGLEVEPLRYLPVGIITPQNVDEYRELADEVKQIDVDQLVSAIIEGDVGNIDSYFERTYQHLVQAKLVSLEYVRGFSIEVLAELITVLKQNNLQGERFLGDYESVFKHMFRQPSVEQSLEWLQSVSHQIVEGLQSRQHRPRTVRGRIVDYVDRNFSKPLSLKTMAYDFGVSAAYLGQAFKRETGKSFSSYVNEQRVTEAIRLLRTTDLRANEIARRVGFSDPNYFYTVFRKITGHYVSEFLK